MNNPVNNWETRMDTPYPASDEPLNDWETRRAALDPAPDEPVETDPFTDEDRQRWAEEHQEAEEQEEPITQMMREEVQQ